MLTAIPTLPKTTLKFDAFDAVAARKRDWSTIELRLADAGDVARYIEIAAAAEAATNGIYVATTLPHLVLKEINDPDSVVYMICCEGTDVGIVSFRHRSASHAHISELALHPAFWGNKIGEQAFDNLMALLFLEGYVFFTIETDPRNSALKLYQSWGFKIHETRQNTPRPGLERHFLKLNSCELD